MYLSQLLCELCAVAYKHDVKVPIFGFTSVKKYEHDNACVYVFKNDKAIVLAFRGSNDINDWISNIHVEPVVTLHGTIHSGFYKEYEKLAPLFEPDINNAEARTIFLTGHSLGGALALITACFFRQLNPVVITFGSPRVGTTLFNSKVSTLRYIRWINGSDKICRLPVRKYSHCGIERRLQFPWYKRLTNRSPHHIYNYLKSIRSNDISILEYEDLLKIE